MDRVSGSTKPCEPAHPIGPLSDSFPSLPRTWFSKPPPSDLPENYLLAQIIERDVIPRLLLATQASTRTQAASPGPRPAPSAAPQSAARLAEILASLAINSDAASMGAEVDSLLSAGMTLPELYRDVLGGAARQLGELWVEDRCSFLDVTIGLTRLHGVLRDTASRYEVPAKPARVAHRIHLAAAPGETHTFGLSMIEELFLHAGWHVTCDTSGAPAPTLRLLANERIDVLGLTIGCTQCYEPLVALVGNARRVSCNPGLGVLVGGAFLQAEPELCQQIPGVTLVLDAMEALQAAGRAIAPEMACMTMR